MQTGRIVQEHKTNYVISTEDGDLSAVVRGTFHTQKDFPKVGDYVHYTIIDDNSVVIENVIERNTEIVRISQARNKRGGNIQEEVLVANIDVMFIVMGLDHDFNIERLERYASLARQSNVKPVIILNKCDMVDHPGAYVAQVGNRLSGVPVHTVSAMSGTNMEVVLDYFDAETTAVLLGSSGAGKSTMTNWLLKRDAQAVQGVREEDSRGRHTTTSRELFAIPSGGFLIDTPGMRELGVMGETEEVFKPIEALAKSCQFSNCEHEKSAGCAVQDAIKNGIISAEQLANYLKLRRERDYIESKTDKESSHQYNEKRRKHATQAMKVVYSKYKARGVK